MPTEAMDTLDSPTQRYQLIGFKKPKTYDCLLSTFHGKVPKFTVMLDLMFEDQDAKEAIKTLNNYEIRPGRFLVVTKSVDNRRLWVGL